jgi:hypothetical protein
MERLNQWNSEKADFLPHLTLVLVLPLLGDDSNIGTARSESATSGGNH